MIRALTLVAALCGTAHAAPCTGISRTITPADRAAAPTIARRLGATRIEVVQVFALRSWRILYVVGAPSDDPFLVFHGPATTRLITLWSGGARAEDEPQIHAWLTAHARGIPDRLAACFANHVLPANRDR